jgi:hypothetical protein
VEFLRHSLRRAVSIAWPYDVLNIQSFLFPWLPYSDLWQTAKQILLKPCFEARKDLDLKFLCSAL